MIMNNLIKGCPVDVAPLSTTQRTVHSLPGTGDIDADIGWWSDVHRALASSARCHRVPKHRLSRGADMSTSPTSRSQREINRPHRHTKNFLSSVHSWYRCNWTPDHIGVVWGRSLLEVRSDMDALMESLCPVHKRGPIYPNNIRCLVET